MTFVVLAGCRGVADSTARDAAAADPAPADEAACAAEAAALLTAYKSANDAYIAPFRDAKSDEERAKLPPLRSEDDPAREFLPKFEALAARARGRDAGLTALLWIVDHGRLVLPHGRETAVRAIDEIAARHAQSPRLERFAEGLQFDRWVFPRDTVVRALRTLIESNPDRSVKGAALVSLATMYSGGWPRDPGPTDADSDVAQREWDEADALLRSAVKDCAGTRWSDRGAALLRERDHLQIGMTAPDFEATDADGVTFRLSDYRGKVVVLDFWSFG